MVTSSILLLLLLLLLLLVLLLPLLLLLRPPVIDPQIVELDSITNCVALAAAAATTIEGNDSLRFAAATTSLILSFSPFYSLSQCICAEGQQPTSLGGNRKS